MISSQEMKELEANSQVPIFTLMDNAGRQIAKTIKEKYELKGKKMLIVCYHGNNGGDGFASSKYLYDDCEIDILFIGDEEKLKKGALVFYKKAEENNKIQFVNDEVDVDDYDFIVDAILGIGVTGSLKEEIKKMIEGINSSKAVKICVDVPTGMNPDTGEISEIAVNPDLVIAMHDIKKGLISLEDKTVVVDIGLKPQ